MRPLWGGVKATVVATVGVCAAVMAPAGAWGQAAPADIRVADVEVSDQGTVTATVVIPDLRASDVGTTDAFEIWEEGEEREVDAAPVAPSDMEVALVVDTSVEQPVQQLREVQSIAMELALRLPRDSPMALVTMGYPAALEQSATTDMLERAAAAGHLEPGGERAAYDALALAMDEPSRLPTARRSIVVVGAGDDQASKATRDDVLEQLDIADAALYIIQPAADGVDPHALDEFATATGGRLVAVDDDRDPLDAAAVVLADLLHQYRLTFETQGRGDTTVSLRVATETISAETTVNVPPPTPAPPTEARTRDDVGGVPTWGWLLLVAALAAGVARLILASTALSVGRWGARLVSAGPDAPEAAGAAALARSDSRPLRGVVSAGRAVRRGVVAAVRRPRALRHPTAPVWRDVAVQVHRDVGGDREALHEAAEIIEAARQRTAAHLHAAGLDGRLAAIALTPLPVVMVAVRHVLDPAYIERLTAGALGWLSLAVAAALTITGALWLRRVAKPPFAALPARWRAYDERAQRWQQDADALDRAWLNAIAGLDLEHALQRALLDERHPRPWLLETLRPAQPAPDRLDDLLAELRTPGPVAVLLSGSSGGPSADLLAAARERLHADWVFAADVQAERLPVSVFVPFVVCILPATLLVGLVAWS